MTDLCFDDSLDIVFENGDFKKEESLKTAVLISLFTDARCEIDEVPFQGKSQKGFWGDTLFGEKTGSKLWLLSRVNSSNETITRTNEYVKEALNWLIEDNIAEDVVVNTYYKNKKTLSLNIQIIKSNKESESIDIENLWDYL